MSYPIIILKTFLKTNKLNQIFLTSFGLRVTFLLGYIPAVVVVVLIANKACFGV